MKKYETFFSPEELETIYNTLCHTIVFKWHDGKWSTDWVERMKKIKKKMDDSKINIAEGAIYTGE